VGLPACPVVIEKTRETAEKTEQRVILFDRTAISGGVFFIKSKTQSKLRRLPRFQIARQAVSPCPA